MGLLQEMLEVGSAIRKVARVLWSMHTLFQEVRTLTRRVLSRLLLFAALMQVGTLAATQHHPGGVGCC
jgi:hypothetical protein